MPIFNPAPSSGSADNSQEPRTIDADKTIPADTSEITVGPVTIAAGVTVTFADVKSRWQVLGGAPETLGSRICVFPPNVGAGSIPGLNVLSAEKMCGFGSFARIRPTTYRTVCLSIVATFSGNETAEIFVIRLRYGTGTPPALDAAATGTTIATMTIKVSGSLAARLRFPFILTAFVPDLIVGTTYWWDLSAVFQAGTGTGGIFVESVTCLGYDL